MQEFENYIKSDITINYEVACFKYNHNVLVKLDKNKKPLKQNIIFINIKFYDKNLNILQSLNLKFVNGILNKTSMKKLNNIKSSILNNIFNITKNDIINNIKGKLTIKFNKIKSKLDDINEYNSCNVDKVSNDAGLCNNLKHSKYDM